MNMLWVSTAAKSMLNNREGNDFHFSEKVGEIHVGDNVFIGSNTTILYNVHIGSNVIIGAGSLVNKDISSDSVWGGYQQGIYVRLMNLLKRERNKRLNSRLPLEGLINKNAA